jgi:hypothetical protein
MGDFEEVFMLHAVIMVCFLVPTPLGVVRASEHFEKKMSRMTPPGTRTLGATNAIVKAPGVRGGKGEGSSTDPKSTISHIGPGRDLQLSSIRKNRDPEGNRTHSAN